MMARSQPSPAGSGIAAVPVSEREETAAARKWLGGRLKMWRERAGLSQEELGLKAEYGRSTVGGVERGKHASREFFEDIDAAVNAGGRLIADYDRAAAIIAAAKHRAAQRARSARAIAMPDGEVPGLELVAAGIITCPSCHAEHIITERVQLVLAPLGTAAGPAGQPPAGQS